MAVDDCCEGANKATSRVYVIDDGNDDDNDGDDDYDDDDGDNDDDHNDDNDWDDILDRDTIGNIMNSTPKIIPLTNFFIQPISYLSGIGISTIPNHRGPPQSPKTAARTTHGTPFSLAAIFSWLISCTPPQKSSR